MPPRSILSHFSLDPVNCIIETFGTGLINRTWKITCNNGSYILQCINKDVFKDPYIIDHNLRLIADHLKSNHPHQLFTHPLTGVDGATLYLDENNDYYRLFKFVEGSHTVETVANPDIAREAAKQFGRFTRQLSDLDPAALKITIPFFHDLVWRFKMCQEAIQNGNSHRRLQAAEQIGIVEKFSWIVEKFQLIQSDPNFRLRVIHHDTKISNVLFDSSGRGIVVIDLDTVMPGYFISDLGDMIRSYLCPVSEEEKDISLIEVREQFYKALVEGYLSEMGDELTPTEYDHIFYSGLFMIYMQAIRFLTDFLENDHYYGERYPGHNLVRTTNQLQLLQKLFAKEPILKNYGSKY